MQDLILWLASGAGTLVLLLIWACIMPGRSLPTPPSEYAAIIFFVMLFGPLALIVVSLISLLMVIVGAFCGAGALIDLLFEKR